MQPLLSQALLTAFQQFLFLLIAFLILTWWPCSYSLLKGHALSVFQKHSSSSTAYCGKKHFTVQWYLKHILQFSRIPSLSSLSVNGIHKSTVKSFLRDKHNDRFLFCPRTSQRFRAFSDQYNFPLSWQYINIYLKHNSLKIFYVIDFFFKNAFLDTFNNNAPSSTQSDNLNEGIWTEYTRLVYSLYSSSTHAKFLKIGAKPLLWQRAVVEIPCCGDSPEQDSD